MSLLERLMIQSNIYKKDPVDDEYDNRVITKLIRNYRSHKILLDVPNRLFYDDELMASKIKRYSSLSFQTLSFSIFYSFFFNQSYLLVIVVIRIILVMISRGRVIGILVLC